MHTLVTNMTCKKKQRRYEILLSHLRCIRFPYNSKPNGKSRHGFALRLSLDSICYPKSFYNLINQNKLKPIKS